MACKDFICASGMCNDERCKLNDGNIEPHIICGCKYCFYFNHDEKECKIHIIK